MTEPVPAPDAKAPHEMSREELADAAALAAAGSSPFHASPWTRKVVGARPYVPLPAAALNAATSVRMDAAAAAGGLAGPFWKDLDID
jgi:hypothetical protein